MPDARERRVVIPKAVAGRALPVRAFEYAHAVVKSAGARPTPRAVTKPYHCADTGREIWRVGLEAPRRERFVEALARCIALVYGVGLVAVRYDQLVLKLSYRRVDNQARVLYLRWVERLRVYGSVSLREDSVSRVLRASHYKICDDRFGAIA